MVLYEKIVNNVRQGIYGTLGKIPSDADQHVIYKDKNGTVITDQVQYGDRFRDDKEQGMNREQDGKNVTVWIGNTMVIPPRGTTGPTITALAFTTPPTKISYKAGDAIDMTGAVVTATYSDSTTADVTAQCTFTPTEVVSETTEITASFGGKTATTPITVLALNQIVFSVAPKTEYLVGEAIDLSGAEVTATFADSTTENVTAKCTFTPAAGTIVTTAMTKITAAFGGKTVDQTITVETVKIYLGVTDNVPSGITGLTPYEVTKEELLAADGYAITLSPNNQFSAAVIHKGLGIKLTHWKKPGLGDYTFGQVADPVRQIYYLNGPDDINPNPYPGGDGSPEATILYFETV